MKAGSLERLPEPVRAGAACSCGAGSSWSEGRKGEGAQGGEGEREREGDGEEGACDDKGRAEAAANTPVEGGGGAGPAAAEVGELDVCLAGCGAAEDFLQGRERSGSVRRPPDTLADHLRGAGPSGWALAPPHPPLPAPAPSGIAT